MSPRVLFICVSVWVLAVIGRSVWADEAAPGPMRSLVVYDDAHGIKNGVVSDAEARARLIAFCAAPRGDVGRAVTRVYLGTGWHGFDKLSVDDQGLRELLSDLHAAGIEVYSLQGYYGWASQKHRSGAAKVVGNVLRFNDGGAPEERFDGLMLDIEPYVMGHHEEDEWAWDQDHEKIWAEYLGVLDDVVKQVDAYNRGRDKRLVLGECIPAFYPATTVEGKGSFQEVMDRVDVVFIMSYFDQKKLLMEMVEDELAYAKQIGKPAVFAVCAIKPDPVWDVHPINTFWEEGDAAMEEVIGTVVKAFGSTGGLGEVSVYSYGSYRALGE